MYTRQASFSKTRTETFNDKANELAVNGAGVAHTHTAEGVMRGKGALLCVWVSLSPRGAYA